jgi:8-oxo-dGTP diphosphatase
MPEYELFRISQNIVLKNAEGKVLILQHPKGKWLLPGGKINKGEGWREALERELSEETGITTFSVGSLIDADNWIENNQAYYAVTFVCSVPIGTQVFLSPEHIAYAWIDTLDLDKYDFWHQSLPERIKKGLKN